MSRKFQMFLNDWWGWQEIIAWRWGIYAFISHSCYPSVWPRHENWGWGMDRRAFRQELWGKQWQLQLALKLETNITEEENELTSVLRVLTPLLSKFRWGRRGKLMRYRYFTVHDGDYWRLLTPGHYIITAYRDGYQPLSHKVIVYERPHEEAQRVDFHLQPLPQLVSNSEQRTFRVWYRSPGYRNRISARISWVPLTDTFRCGRRCLLTRLSIWTGMTFILKARVLSRPATAVPSSSTRSPTDDFWHSKKVKVKWSRYRPSVAQRVGRVLLFHDRGTRRGWVVSSTSRTHYTPRKDQVPILQELGGPQGRSGRAEKLAPTGIPYPDRPAHSQSPSRLRYPALHHQVRPGNKKLTINNVVIIVSVSDAIR